VLGVFFDNNDAEAPGLPHFLTQPTYQKEKRYKAIVCCRPSIRAAPSGFRWATMLRCIHRCAVVRQQAEWKAKKRFNNPENIFNHFLTFFGV